ncbi:MAG TPA: tyrosine-type recombinase/integrase [Acidimicrobiales bacterium]|nr:tyrosine-type recombinase/integrase [Acidimicrobiales bacterium]
MREWRSGSLRERRPGLWEIRIAVATDPLTGQSIQRSFTTRGSRGEAEERCAELAAQYASRREVLEAAPFITVGQVLERWLASDHDWAPSTWSGYRSTARAILSDPLAATRVARLGPELVRAALGRWRSARASTSVLSGRFRVLKAALGWAKQHGLVDRNPLDGVRGFPQPEARLHAPVAEILRLIHHAVEHLEKARADDDGTAAALRRVRAAERLLLLVRVAADTGARRGELAALKIADLDGRVLSITRGTSMERVGPTKTRRPRRLTVGATTSTLWRELVGEWEARLPEGAALGEWLFSSDPMHQKRLTTSHLAHCFARLRTSAGVPEVTLHRLRHSVATFLVDRGDILKAQLRLGHRDASTTLRNYAHALPLEDLEVADALDALLSPVASRDT